MRQITVMNNGACLGFRVAEITAIPYFELIDRNLDRANTENQIFFLQMLHHFFRKSSDGAAALELIFSSIDVTNQTYRAQVKIHLVVRQMGVDEQTVTALLDAYENNLKNDFTDKFFDIRFLCEDREMEGFFGHLSGLCQSEILSVTKKECAVLSTLGVDGYVYYTQTPSPAENVNTSSLTNVLSQYPQSAIFLQIIPTCFNQAEITAIEQTNLLLNYYAGNMMFQMHVRPDIAFREVAAAYAGYKEMEKDSLFYYNFIVAGAKNCAFDIAGKLADALENSDKQGGRGYEVVPLNGVTLDFFNAFGIMPWYLSNQIIFNNREPLIWKNAKPPQSLIRLKQLAAAGEVKPVFKVPLDDGRTIGIRSKKVLINRERLNDNIISKDSFKVGIIQNAAKNGLDEGAHAGIPLNQFTKHGLIVGMPGSGKTNFSLGLLLRFWKEFHIPFLAIEPTKTEYRSLIDVIPELQIFTPGKNNVSPFVINPFLPPRGVTVESYTPSLVAAFRASFSMPNPLPDIFLSAINDCYNEYGWKKNSLAGDPDAELFGLYEFVKVFKRNIEHSNYRGETKANIESAGIVRLVSLIEQNSNIYDTIHTIPLDDLLHYPTVLELNAINNKEQKSLIMALMLILFCAYTKNNVAGDGRLKNILLIDEAHVLLGKGHMDREGADSQGSTVETLEDLIKEIRAYGTGIIIADQSPTSVGREIVANTDVKIIFKLVEKENKEAVRTATNMSDLNYELLGRLGVGEALLHFGKLDSHLQIRTYNVHDKSDIRDVIPDQEIKGLIHYWDTHQELLMAHRECFFNGYCVGCCDQEVRNNADFLATKLVNERLYALEQKADLLRYLVGMNGDIGGAADQYSTISYSKRLLNCTKIKFLRKAMMKRNFNISKREYDGILRHPRFLVGEHT